MDGTAQGSRECPPVGKGLELGTVVRGSPGESGVDRVEDAVEQHERDMEADGRVSGRIHQPEFRAFWREELQADTWTLAVLADGYAPPWSQTPERYREPNNRSALGEEQFVWDTVQAWVHQGAVEVTAGPATCVSPLTVAVSYKPDGSVKKRLCLDGSRYINLLLPRESFRMTTVQSAAEMIEEGDWQFTYDLESAYFHVMIAEKDRDYLGFAAVNPATRIEVFFRFRVMPFGLATAARTMTRMTCKSTGDELWGGRISGMFFSVSLSSLLCSSSSPSIASSELFPNPTGGDI